MKKLAAVIILVLMPALAHGAQWNPADVIQEYLLENYPWDEIQIGPVDLSSPQPARMPEKITVEKMPLGKTVFRLGFGGGRYVLARTEVKAFDQVVMSRKPLRKGRTVRQGDVYETMMDVRRIQNGTFRDIGSVEGKALSRSVAANRPLRDTMVDAEDRVQRGKSVVIVASSPGMKIRMLGALKENGRIGSFVKVVNISSRKVLTGLLVDADTVKVRF